ncbi:MAG: serine/threonine-protein kinase, partial [Nannocystaceae bacterium]
MAPRCSMTKEYGVPRRLGEYQLRRPIGRGGMGEVWLAAKDGLTKPCVVKVLLPRYSADPEYRRRFFREAEILAMLRHGRIVPIIDYGESRGWLYIVMEYIDGVDLGTFCRALVREGGRVPANVAAYVIGEVLEALRHAHERSPGGEHRGVIHRDVTPGNVMISSEGEVFLTDFGLALRETELSGEVFGTLEYMAPEQVKGCACFQSDLFAAGGVLYFMLTGRPPRQARNVAQLIANLEVVQHEICRDDVATPVQRLIELCLVTSLAERIESARDGILLLDKWPGYRKETTVTAALYSSYVGPRKTGLTG